MLSTKIILKFIELSFVDCKWEQTGNISFPTSFWQGTKSTIRVLFCAEFQYLDSRFWSEYFSNRLNKAQPSRQRTMTCHHFGLWFAYIKLLIISTKVSVNVKWICSSYLVKINFEPSVGSSLEFVMLRNTCFTSIEPIQLNRVRIFEDDEMKVNLCDPNK